MDDKEILQLIKNNPCAGLPLEVLHILIPFQHVVIDDVPYFTSWIMEKDAFESRYPGLC
jgi:hypothetical protein